MSIFNFLKSDSSNSIEFKAITIGNKKIEVHPYREQEALRDKYVVQDIYEIFGDISNIPFNEEKFIKNKKDIDTYNIVSAFNRNKQFTHFVSHIASKKIIGEIIIFPPNDTYINFDKNLKNTWIIEYYINKDYWNMGIMTNLLPVVVRVLKNQGIRNVAAVVDRLNLSSIRVLEKSEFKKIKEFDDLKDLYVI